MPANTRQWSRRELEAATRNIEWAMEKVVKIADIYSTDHPEIATPLLIAIDTLSEVINLLRKTRSRF